MYRHLYDIPHMCALMRAQDLRNPDANIFVYNQLQTDMSIGRGLYQHVLEFFIRDVESAHHRLSRAIPLVIEATKAPGDKPEEKSTKTELSRWLYGNLEKPEKETLRPHLCWLQNKFKGVDDRRILKYEVEKHWVADYGAIAISLLPFIIFEKDNISEKRKKKLQGMH